MGDKVETVVHFIFLGSKTTVDGDCSHEIRRWLLLGRKAMTKLDCVENQRHYSASKGPYSLPSGYVRLWELDHNEGRTPKNWCLQTVLLEKTSESPLDSKEIKPVNPKGNQHWIITGRTDGEAEAPVFWSSDGNRIGKSQFSFQSQRQAMPKNAQTTTQWYSSHTLVK